MKISELIIMLNADKAIFGDIPVAVHSTGIDSFGGYISDDISLSLLNYELDDEDFLAIEANHNLVINRKKKSADESKEQVHEYARLELKKWSDKSGNDIELIKLLNSIFKRLEQIMFKKSK